MPHQTQKRNGKPRASTISDVAHLAKVSTATVSRTINSPDVVRPEVRERVAEAIRQLNYIPNDSARALRQNQSRLIGVIVPTLSYALYAEFFSALQFTLTRNGFFAVLTTTQYDLRVEAQQIIALVKQGVQGLVLTGQQREPKAQDFLAAAGIPYINTYSVHPQDQVPAIGFDNSAAIVDVVTHLSGLGHRRIAMLSGLTSNNNDRAIARVSGFKSAVTAQGLQSPEWIVEAPYTITGGRIALQQLFARGIKPSAIVCGSDMLAIGALQECKARNLRVPEEMSLMGFDDLEISRHLEPSLSTVSVPSTELGDLAAQAIIALCRHEPYNEQHILQTRLVLRATTAAPKPAGSRPRRRTPVDKRHTDGSPDPVQKLAGVG